MCFTKSLYYVRTVNFTIDCASKISRLGYMAETFFVPASEAIILKELVFLEFHIFLFHSIWCSWCYSASIGSATKPSLPVTGYPDVFHITLNGDTYSRAPIIPNSDPIKTFIIPSINGIAALRTFITTISPFYLITTHSYIPNSVFTIKYSFSSVSANSLTYEYTNFSHALKSNPLVPDLLIKVIVINLF